MSTHWGEVTSLLAQHLDERLESVYPLQTAARVHLAAIPSMDEALQNLGMIYFFTLHLFSMSGCHLSSLMELLQLIERL